MTAPFDPRPPTEHQFLLDGRPVPFTEGQTILQAARTAGLYIPSLCWDPRFAPHGSCKLCVVKAAGRHVSACATQAREGWEVESSTPEINDMRRGLLQMLFVSGEHFCPGCEKSGHCKLQALGYEFEMLGPRFPHFHPQRPVDASHPELMLDLTRCVLCELCVRASREVDHTDVFGVEGRGIHKRLVVNAPSGQLADTPIAATDLAARICPVGAILPKGRGFAVPIGERPYDRATIRAPIPGEEDTP